MRYNHRNRSLLRLRNRLRLHARLNLTRQKVLDELADILNSKFLGLAHGELLVLDGLLDGKSGPLADVEVKVLGVLAKGFGVDGGEVDGAFVGLGDGL